MTWATETNVIDHSGMTLRVANVEIAGTPTIEAEAATLTLSDTLDVAGAVTLGDTVDITGAVTMSSTATADSLTFGGTTNILTLVPYVATVTVANGQTTGKEAAIAIPANFAPIGAAIHVTTAATNAVTLTDVGDDVDTDSFFDNLGSSVALNSTGYKGFFFCNGTRGNPGGTTAGAGAMATPDEIEVVISGDPGATGTTIRFTIFGVVVS